METFYKILDNHIAEMQQRHAVIFAAGGRIAEAEALAEALSTLGAKACAMMLNTEVITWVQVNDATVEQIKSAIAAADLCISSEQPSPKQNSAGHLSLRIADFSTEICSSPTRACSVAPLPLAA